MNKPRMSLQTQVYALIVLLGIITFAVKLKLSSEQTQAFYQQQMATHARDTATSLGLAISPYLNERDMMVARTMVQAIFDSGYYAQIELKDDQSKSLVNLNHNPEIHGVPSWFMRLFQLTAPTYTKELNSGWKVGGFLSVTTHPGAAYIELWQQVKQAAISSAMILVIALSLAYFVLRSVFRPLRKVEQQAQRIGQKQFVQNNASPKSRELFSVTKAMNDMVTSIQRTFDALTKQSDAYYRQAYRDELTGLGNRRAFDNQLSAVTEQLQDEHTHSVAMVTLPSLQLINEHHDYRQGDAYVLAVLEVIKRYLAHLGDYHIYRISGGTFTIHMPYPCDFVAETLSRLHHSLQKEQHHRYEKGFAHLSIASVNSCSTVGSILSELDTAISTASPDKPAMCQTHNLVQSQSQWRETIVRIIEQGNFSYSFQPVRKQQQQQAHYFETFVRISDQGKSIDNQQLFAMAERLGLACELEKKLFQAFINFRNTHTELALAVNLSKEAFYNEDFITWVCRQAHHYGCLRHNTVLEIGEATLLADIAMAKNVLARLKAFNIKVCIEHFGSSLTSFRYLRDLNIDYVKVDAAYTKDLQQNDDALALLRSIVTTCTGIGIKTIACHIENAVSFDKAMQLQFDGLQGNYIKPPMQLEEGPEQAIFNFQTRTL
ncbi:bifunctional diguanylate cyclase/phosphodiesterase [Pseudoalteromonas ruthenica]|uniref:bifunctional diguanylate cyclase/phosphodiesterase n=1 Tax=Pseudoalteromonas ruthenica TaxID=151081 RepID=UPI00241C2C61|nr:EAL domain-containing protein [Pseudoalteromonas ruthenica]|tara:strand:- start:32753 stop:34729 length:1977 start_codon:yes stop_codon:yes gene_type:complete